MPARSKSPAYIVLKAAEIVGASSMEELLDATHLKLKNL